MEEKNVVAVVKNPKKEWVEKGIIFLAGIGGMLLASAIISKLNSSAEEAFLVENFDKNTSEPNEDIKV